jgi:hypothetical protein
MADADNPIKNELSQEQVYGYNYALAAIQQTLRGDIHPEFAAKSIVKWIMPSSAQPPAPAAQETRLAFEAFEQRQGISGLQPLHPIRMIAAKAWEEASATPTHEATERVQWMPIETAPKDGKLVLLSGGKETYYGGCFPSTAECTGTRLGYWSERNNCWEEHNTETQNDPATTLEPTHFMPLPQLALTTGGKSEGGAA